MIMDVYLLNMRTKLKSFILTALLFALVSGVSGQVDSSQIPAPKKTTANIKLNGKWYLIPASDSDTATGRIPEISFDVKASKFSGNTGCNRMSGTYVATDSILQFSDKMVTTRMYCAGYSESPFLQNLLRVETYKFRKGLLVLLVGEIEVSRWTRKNPQAAKKLTKPAPL
jgi:heat shock protein HslJ